MITQKHPFHLVDPSPWPLVGSIAAFCITSGTVMYMHGFSGGLFIITTGFSLLFYTMYIWWRDIIREGTFEGQHTSMVQLGLRYGIILFITSEVMLFFAFFWAFFWASLSPVPEIGSVWPPQSVEVFNAWEIPLLNTLILVTSGASCTWAHHAIVAGKKESALQAMVFTLVLAFAFTGFQLFEYSSASFSISDSVYGSTFYMATGLHGFHVLVGSIFLAVCGIRIFKNHFTRTHHFGFEAAAWYWHFVDVVWIFLFIAIYWWGGNL